MITNTEMINKLKEMKNETDNVYVISKLNEAIEGIRRIEANGWK